MPHRQRRWSFSEQLLADATERPFGHGARFREVTGAPNSHGDLPERAMRLPESCTGGPGGVATTVPKGPAPDSANINVI